MPLTMLKLLSVAQRAIIPVIDPGLCSKASPAASPSFMVKTRKVGVGCEGDGCRTIDHQRSELLRNIWLSR